RAVRLAGPDRLLQASMVTARRECVGAFAVRGQGLADADGLSVSDARGELETPRADRRRAPRSAPAAPRGGEAPVPGKICHHRALPPTRAARRLVACAARVFAPAPEWAR